MRGELFTAVRGEGAWLESGDVSASAGESVHPRLDLRAGPAPLPPGRAARPGAGRHRVRLPGGAAKVQGEVVAALLPRIRDIRRNGVASVDLCAVAAGRLDGYYERGLNYWDWAGAPGRGRGRRGRRRPARRGAAAPR